MSRFFDYCVLNMLGIQSHLWARTEWRSDCSDGSVRWQWPSECHIHRSVGGQPVLRLCSISQHDKFLSSVCCTSVCN